MHAVTSFYRPTILAWENTNPVPSVLSRAPEDETLRSALVDALDLSQSLCTNAGHERLLGLLGGGNGGTGGRLLYEDEPSDSFAEWRQQFFGDGPAGDGPIGDDATGYDPRYDFFLGQW